MDDKLLAKIKTNPRPLVIDVWAPWCGPCRAIAPVLDSLAKEYQGQVDVLKVNADQHPDLVQLWKVQGIPTLLAFNQGTEVTRLIGVQPRSRIEELFQVAQAGTGTVNQDLTGRQRLMRILFGLALLLVGWLVANSWLLAVAGLAVIFSAVHDRCPLWQAISPWLRNQKERLSARLSGEHS